MQRLGDTTEVDDCRLKKKSHPLGMEKPLRLQSDYGSHRGTHSEAWNCCTDNGNTYFEERKKERIFVWIREVRELSVESGGSRNRLIC